MKRYLTNRLILMLALFLVTITVGGQTARAESGTRHIERAEKILRKLDALEALTGLLPHEYRERGRKLWASVQSTASELPEGNVKTDLMTAAHFYAGAAEAHQTPEVFEPRCEQERPGVYRNLCLESGGNRRELLLGKARLHTRWARDVLHWQQGGDDTGLKATLDEVEAEREFDRLLSKRAIEALKRLEGVVFVYKSLASFEEGGRKLAGTSVEEFTGELYRVSQTVRRILIWLPQNRCRNEIRNALQSYLDGRWWWSKVHLPPVIRVIGNTYVESDARLSRMVDSETASYTVVVNWRHARHCTLQAQRILNATEMAVLKTPMRKTASIPSKR